MKKIQPSTHSPAATPMLLLMIPSPKTAVCCPPTSPPLSNCLCFFLWSDVLEWKEAAWILLVFRLEVIDGIITSTIDSLLRFWWRNFVTTTGTHQILDALEDMAGDCNEAKYLSHVALENGLATFRGLWDMSGLMFKRSIWIFEQLSRCPRSWLVAWPLSVRPCYWSLSVAIHIDTVHSLVDYCHSRGWLGWLLCLFFLAYNLGVKYEILGIKLKGRSRNKFGGLNRVSITNSGLLFLSPTPGWEKR